MQNDLRIPIVSDVSNNARAIWNVFLPLFVIHCMEQIYFVYGNVLQNYELSPQAIGWVLSVFFLAIMCMRPVGSLLLENIGVRNTLFIGGVIGVVGGMVLFFARSVPSLLLGRALTGASFGIYTIGLFSYQALAIPDEIRGAAFAIIVTGGILPSATVTPIGEWMILNAHTGLYLSMGPVFCLLCIYLARRLDVPVAVEKRGGRRKTWGRYRDLLALRSFRMLVTTGVMISLVDASVVCISMLAAERGLIASFYLASGAVFAVIVRTAGAHMLNLMPRRLFFAPCGLLMASALFLVSVAPSNTMFLVTGAFFGVGIGIVFPTLLSLVSDLLPAELRPKGVAFALLAYDCGWILTPLIVGYFSSVLGSAWTFRLLSLASLSALIALQFLYWVPHVLGQKPDHAVR